MLKLNPNPTFDAEVRITVPGQVEPESVTLTFAYKSRSELSEYLKGMSGQTDLEALQGVVVGWSGIDAEFSKDALASLIDNYHAAAGDIIAGYVKALAESRAKN